MGFLVEEVAAFVGGHRISIDSKLHLFGCRPRLMIDGRCVASELAIMGAQAVFLAARVGDLRVLAEVRQGWTASHYRLFVDEVQVPLSITRGGKRFVSIPKPLLLSDLRPVSPSRL